MTAKRLSGAVGRTRPAAALTAALALLAALASAGYVVASALAAPALPAPAAQTTARTTTQPIKVSFPAAGRGYGPASWLAGCHPAGICGTTAARAGVRTVAVSIYRYRTRRYWTGTSFAARTPSFRPATGATSWHYSFWPERAGNYRVTVRATGRQASRPAVHLSTVRFHYDTSGPPAPRIVRHPAGRESGGTALFAFTDAISARLTFYCDLDQRPASRCTWSGRKNRHAAGDQRYRHLGPGWQCFYVYAVNRAGIAGPASIFCWSVLPRGSGFPFPHPHPHPSGQESFAVGGNPAALLYPGVTEPLDLTFTNPGTSAITIASGGIGGANIAISTDAPGCPASNFVVAKGLTASVTVPASQETPVSLAELSIPSAGWPAIEMLDTNANQDACEGVTLTLTYSGIEATG